MRITYVTHTRFPTEKAHGFQVASVCHALAKLGHTVTLLTPTVGNTITEEPLQYYGIPSATTLSVVQMPSFDALSSRWVPGKLALLVSMNSYRRILSLFLQDHRADLFYARSPEVLPPLLAHGAPVVFEVHTVPTFRQRQFVALCNACTRVVCLTSLLREALCACGVRPDRLLKESDGVDLQRYMALLSPIALRGKYNLPTGVPVIGYAGALVTRESLEKGVGELLEALRMLQECNVPFFGWIIGGPLLWAEQYREKVQNLGIGVCARLEGHIRSTEVPAALSACDVLVYPVPVSQHPYFLRDTSPLKLFEYMASGRPIVCADLPPLHDVVDRSVVRFYSPNNPKGLAEALTWVLDHPEEAKYMAGRAKGRVRQYSWEARMARILATIPAQAPRFALASS